MSTSSVTMKYFAKAALTVHRNIFYRKSYSNYYVNEQVYSNLLNTAWGPGSSVTTPLRNNTFEAILFWSSAVARMLLFFRAFSLSAVFYFCSTNSRLSNEKVSHPTYSNS